MPNYSFKEGVTVRPKDLENIILRFPEKFGWFLSKGYAPHYYQTLFHGNNNKDCLTRFRHLVAGRRGGKTLSAAWEVLFYSLYPEQFHKDAYGKDSDNPLWVWATSKDYKVLRPALLTLRKVITEAGMSIGKDVKENRGAMTFEFPNGSLIEFKSSDDPQSLRGAGLDILWMDEAAFIRSEEPWQVMRPALSDKEGLLITTTTPDGKNWFYDEFWNKDAMKDENQGRVEYRSIDNPYFPKTEWEYTKQRYHPLLFAQEYMAAFDSMAGRDLAGEWLHYYTEEDLPRNSDGTLQKLRKYMGVDPAVSMSGKGDRFVISVVGVSNDNKVYLLDQYAAKIPFAEQLEKIQEYYLRYNADIIGIESNAYQAALVQQAERLPSMPPIVPIFAKGKKYERIMAMSPLFRIGKVRIRQEHRDFIDEWINYDASVRNPKDDCLDSVEIALRTAGALLGDSWVFDENSGGSSVLPDWVVADRPSGRREDSFVDEMMGSMW
jgi:phage terminase large subunit-like protein